MDNKKIYIINGSPRKNQNTAKMCSSFALGVESTGIEAEIVNLYDLNFKGCQSCFACKLRGGKNLGRCAYPDDLKEVLNKVSYSNGIAFASPIYFGDVTGVMKAFMERLLFPFVTYDENYTPIPPKKLETAVIYTMNVNEEMFIKSYIGANNSGPLGFFENWISHIYKKPVRVCAFNTYQFSDYSKYVADVWDEKEKAKQRDEVFPIDLKNAYEAGKNMGYMIINNGK